MRTSFCIVSGVFVFFVVKIVALPSSFCLDSFISLGPHTLLVVTGLIRKTSSKDSENANLVCWRQSDIHEWRQFAEDTIIASDHMDLDSEVVGRLPNVLGGNFQENANDDILLSAFILNSTLPRDIFELRSKNAKTNVVSHLPSLLRNFSYKKFLFLLQIAYYTRLCAC